MTHEIDKVGIKLKDGTVYILEGPEIAHVEISLQQDQEATWVSQKRTPFTATSRATAHMHLHLISDKLVMMRDDGPEELESGAALRLKGDDHG